MEHVKGDKTLHRTNKQKASLFKFANSGIGSDLNPTIVLVYSIGLDSTSELTLPLEWLAMSHRGMRALIIVQPSNAGIKFCRVITVDTAHLEQTFPT